MEPNFVSGKALIILLPLLLSLYKSKNCREIRSKSTFIVMKKITAVMLSWKRDKKESSPLTSYTLKGECELMIVVEKL